MEGNSIIVYYSWVGNTAVVAKEIQKQTGYEIVRLEEVKERCFKKIAGAALGAVLGLKSRLKPFDFSLKGYNNIFLGAQVWAGKTPPAINTFLAKADFTGKKVWLFFTKGSENLPEKVLASVTQRIEKKGGKVIDSISFTSKWEPGKDTVIPVEDIKDTVSGWLNKSE